jgi:hypothetical protein
VDEVRVRCDRLLTGGLSVPEKTTFLRAHLEEAEILAVLRVGLEARLAPRHSKRLLAVLPEHLADGPARRSRCSSSRLALVEESPYRRDRPGHPGQTPLRALEGGLRAGLVFRRAQERAVVREEPNRAPVSVGSLELAREPGFQGSHYSFLLRLAIRVDRLPRLRRRSGLYHENEREQANE